MADDTTSSGKTRNPTIQRARRRSFWPLALLLSCSLLVSGLLFSKPTALGEAVAEKSGLPISQTSGSARMNPLYQSLPTVLGVSPFQPNLTTGGIAVAITIHPADQNIVIVATGTGGLYKSTDRGATWRFLDTLPAMRMLDVKFNPQDGNLVFATALADSHVANLGGVWRSWDAGETWQQINLSDTAPPCEANLPLTGYGIDFEKGQEIVYIGTSCGLAIGYNYGESWAHVVTNPVHRDVIGVAAAGNGVVHICGFDGHQRSTNHGLDFSPANGQPARCFSPHAIAISPLEPQVILLAGKQQPYTAGCSSSLHEGYASETVTWSRVVCNDMARPPWVVTQARGTWVDVFYGTGFRLLRNTCGSGGSGKRCPTTGWEATPSAHPDQNHIAYEIGSQYPRYLASDGGVAILENTTYWYWAPVGNGRRGIDALQIYDIHAQLGLTSNSLYFGTQDNGFYYSTNNGRNWSTGGGGEGFNIQIPRYRSGPGAERMSYHLSGDPKTVKSNRFMRDLIDWREPAPYSQLIGLPTLLAPGVYVQAVYSETTRQTTIYASPNEDLSWSAAGTTRGLPWQRSRPQASLTGEQEVIYMMVNKPVGKVGLVKILGVNQDGSLGSFNVQDASGADLGSLNKYNYSTPGSYAVDPWDVNHLIAADVLSGSMKISTNGGISWTTHLTLTNLVNGVDTIGAEPKFYFSMPYESTGGLYGDYGRETQVHVVAFDPYHHGRILVGTDVAGLFYSDDYGATWQAVPDSQQIFNIMDIFFLDPEPYDPNRSALVASYGRGLWKVTFPYAPYYPFHLAHKELSLWDDWLVNPLNGAPVPVDILFDTQAHPLYKYFVLKNGLIKNILFDSSGIVQSLQYMPASTTLASPKAGDPPTLLASSADGFEIAESIPMELASETGDFKYCPACLQIIQQGGVVKGLILSNGQIQAVIAGVGDLPAESSLWTRYPIEPSQAPDYQFPTDPFIAVLPNLTYEGQQVLLQGNNFSGDPACSLVSITSNGELILDQVQPDESGRFDASFSAGPSNGMYKILAKQTCSTQTLEDFQYLLVRHGDQEDFFTPLSELFLPLVSKGK